MLVKVKSFIFNTEKEPVMLVFNNMEEKMGHLKNVWNMDSKATKLAYFPDNTNLTGGQRGEFMSLPNDNIKIEQSPTKKFNLEDYPDGIILGYDKPKSLETLFQELESHEFECTGGYLINSSEYIEIKRRLLNKLPEDPHKDDQEIDPRKGH